MKFTNENIIRDIIPCCEWRPDDTPYRREGNIVYAKYTSLREVFEKEKNNDPYVLVTEEGDYTIYYESYYTARIKYTNGYPHGYFDPQMTVNVRKWYGTNLNVIYSTNELLPFGTLKKHNDLLKEKSLVDPKDKDLLYINFSPSSSYNRIRIARNLDRWSKFARIHFPPMDGPADEYALHMEEYMESLTRHKFIFCPEGSGIDTFRIWEALSVGCIPILERSYFSHYFGQLLPILVVNDFLDVTQELLIKAYEEIMSKDYELQRLTKKYWLDRIEADANNTR